MTFLPIVERELRVASRRKSTFRFRSLAAGSTLLLGGFYALMFGSTTRGAPGTLLFQALSWILFVLCLVAGVFLGADSLSEERREGTLGFLFLTDLRGYDVVLGKFIGVSLNAFYSLFAAVPVLALPIMMGGVTGAEYWRMMLALVNALFFSFAVAIFISARCTESEKALFWTSGLLFLSVILLPCLYASFDKLPKVFELICKTSPSFPMYLASSAHYLRKADTYWASIGISQLFGWCLIIWTCIWVSRTVTTKKVSSGGGVIDRLPLLGKLIRKLMRRDRRLLSPNPIVWLLDSPLPRRALMALAITLVAVLVAYAAFAHHKIAVPASITTFYITIILMKPLVAAQACRLFGKSRQDGTLELLRCTPLSSGQFMKGQWSTLIRMFGPPALTIFLGLLTACVLDGGSEMSVGVMYNLYFGLKAVTGFYAVSWVWNLDVTQDPHTDARGGFDSRFYRRAADGVNLYSGRYHRRNFNCGSQCKGAKSQSNNHRNTSNGGDDNRSFATTTLPALDHQQEHNHFSQSAGGATSL